MATTLLTVRSERVAQTQLKGTSSNIDSAIDIAELFTLPAGFGDCLLAEMSVQLTSIQTAVANSELRGPTMTIQAVDGATELFQLRRWTKFLTGTALSSWRQFDRMILWRQEETMSVNAATEDSGAGDTTDVTVLIKVVRLRNIGP